MNRKLAATTICYCNLETFVQGTFFRKVVVTSIIEGQDKNLLLFLKVQNKYKNEFKTN